MSSSEKPSVYVFGDNHTHPREDVKARLQNVTPEDAEVLVMEHCKKTDNQETSQWVVLKNPSLLLMQLALNPLQNWKRSEANRITGEGQTSVAEEVADELSLQVEYIEYSARRQHVAHREPGAVS